MLYRTARTINPPTPQQRIEVLADGRILVNSRKTAYRIRGDVLTVDAGGRARRLFRGWGCWTLDKLAIGAASGRRCTGLEIHADGVTWSADLAQLQRHGTDLGDGRVSLALRYWTQREAAGPPEDDTGAQMALLTAPAGAPGKGVRP